MAEYPIITIDGPGGVGKSTVAKRLAECLGIAFLDSGAHYRAFTLAAMKNNVDFSDQDALVELACSVDLEVCTDENSCCVYLDGKDVSEEIRTPELTRLISKVAAAAGVRKRVNELLRKAAAQRGGAVAEGRDMGTVVFPDADVKFYLDANEDVRARRRFNELDAKGCSMDLETIKDDMTRRDEKDRCRELAPLRASDDAHIVDTSTLSISEVTEYMVNEVARMRENMGTRERLQDT